MGVSGFVTWTAPMFLLFLQEINSGSLPLSRRNPHFSTPDRAKNSERKFHSDSLIRKLVISI